MNDKQSRNFWEVAFSPDRDFIIVFLIMLLITALTGNFFYSLLTDSESLTSSECLTTIGVILGLLLIAGFIWDQRKIRYIPFRVNEKNKLQRAQAVIAIPSNPGTIGKIIRFNSGTLQHLWLVGDESVDNNYKECEQLYKDYGVKFHRIIVSDREGNPSTIFEGYKRAVEEAVKLNISPSQIVVDITGGKKPMSINGFLLAIEQGLKISYVESNYEQIEGTDEIKRSGEEFQVTQFDTSVVPSKSIYEQDNEDNSL
jgi:hypothetical protein